jgi:hypothetical protein
MEPASQKPASAAAQEEARATPSVVRRQAMIFAALFLNILFGRDHVAACLTFSSCADGRGLALNR